MLSLAYNQRPQYFQIDGVTPLSGGRITYFDVNTTTPKSVFADPYGNIQLPNPLHLDIGGFVPVSSVFYGEGNYTILLERLLNPGSPTPTWAEEYTIPDVPGSIIDSLGGTQFKLIEAVDQIQSLPVGIYDFVYCTKYYSGDQLDEGGGWFQWFPASTAPTDLGTIFNVSGSPSVGRYIRIYPSSSVLASYYGVVEGKGTNMSSRLTQAAAYATANDMTLHLTTGDIQCQGSFVLNAPSVVIDSGFKLVRLSLLATDMTINAGKITKCDNGMFISQGTDILLNSVAPIDILPQWWGAIMDGVADDFTPFALAIPSALSSGRLVVSGIALIKAMGNPGSPQLDIGDIYFTGGSYINNYLGDTSIIVRGNVFTENKTEWCFRAFNYELQRYWIMTPAKTSWFFNKTPNLAEFTNAISAVVGGVNDFRNSLTWDALPLNESYLLNFSYDTNTNISHIIPAGSYITLNYPVRLNNLQVGEYSWCNGTSFPLLDGGITIKAVWFYWSTFNNATTLSRAFACCAANFGSVDGGGSTWPVSTTVTLPSSGGLTIKNFVFQKNGSIFPDSPPTTDAYITWENCYFPSYSRIKSSSSLTFNNCTFALNTTVDSFIVGAYVAFNNCSFQEHGGLNVTGLKILNGCGGNAYFIVTNPSNCTITGSAGSSITLTASTSAYVVNGLTITGCTVRDNIYADLAIATYGHNANISGNTSLTQTINSTKTKLNISRVIGGLSTIDFQMDDAVITANRILPRALQPKYCNVHCINVTTNGANQELFREYGVNSGNYQGSYGSPSVFIIRLSNYVPLNQSYIFSYQVDIDWS